MISAANKSSRTSNTSPLGVVIGIVLCLTATCDTSVLAQVLDRNIYFCSGSFTVSEVVDPPEDDDDMLRSASSAERRADRKQSTPGSAWCPGPIPTIRGICGTSPTSLLPAHRSGSEHAQRNGLGAPLLC